MSIEQAAAAFAADMGGTKSLSSDPGARETSAPESIFDASADHDTSEIAGGDGRPTVEEIQGRPRKAKEPVAQDDDEVEDDEEGEFDPFADEQADEDEDDENKEEKDDEDENADPVLSKKFVVQVDGEDLEVTVDEAIKGYMRQETFHRRMNKVDEARQAVVGEGRKILDQRAKVDEMLSDVQAVLESLVPAEPNWDELFAKNPAEARALQKQYAEFQKKVSDVVGKRKANADAATEQSMGEIATYKNNEARKFASTAKWSDKKSMEKDLSSMKRTALAIGFSEEEVAQVYDSRMLSVLLKASKYDRMMANKPKPVRTDRQQQPATPGAGRAKPRNGSQGNGRAMENLRKVGSVEAAASVFHNIIRDRR